MTPVNTITIDVAEDIANGFGATVVARQDVSDHRWYTRQLIVFQLAGVPDELRGFYYLEPKTELQEGADTFESNPVEVYRVEGREVTRTVYEVVE